MDVRPKSPVLVAKILVFLSMLIAVAIFLMKPPLTSSIASAQGERVFENAIPENAPFRIKIKKEKEKSFKDLKDEKWVREFELELTNTGEKPIFFVYINLVTDVKIGNSPLIFALVYGRAELGDIITKAGPDDESIKPGETYVFKIHPGQVLAWEKSLREKTQLDASRIKAKIEMLSFGDGTGYFVNKPYPRAEKRQSKLHDQINPPNRGGPKTSGWPRFGALSAPKSISVKQSLQIRAGLVRDRPHHPRQRRPRHRVPIALTPALLARRIAPIRLIQRVVLIRFKDLDVVTR